MILKVATENAFSVILQCHYLIIGGSGASVIAAPPRRNVHRFAFTPESLHSVPEVPLAALLLAAAQRVSARVWGDPCEPQNLA